MRLIDHTDNLHSLVEQYQSYYQEHHEKDPDNWPVDERDHCDWMDDFMAWMDFTGNYS